jgi:hypothetical protein
VNRESCPSCSSVKYAKPYIVSCSASRWPADARLSIYRLILCLESAACSASTDILWLVCLQNTFNHIIHRKLQNIRTAIAAVHHFGFWPSIPSFGLPKRARDRSPAPLYCAGSYAPLVHRLSTGRSHTGGSAHSPRRGCAEPSQASALVHSDRLESNMAKMWLRENSAAATVLNYLALKVN